MGRFMSSVIVEDARNAIHCLHRDANIFVPRIPYQYLMVAERSQPLNTKENSWYYSQLKLPVAASGVRTFQLDVASCKPKKRNAHHVVAGMKCVLYMVKGKTLALMAAENKSKENAMWTRPMLSPMNLYATPKATNVNAHCSRAAEQIDVSNPSK